MAISTFATPTTGFTSIYAKFTGAQAQAVMVDIPVGYYEFSWIQNDLATGTTFGTFSLVDTSGTSTAYTTVDNNTADARNVSVINVNITVPIASITTTSQTGNLVCRRIGDVKTTLTGNVTVYTTSQSITFTASTPCILVGGGGGGGGSTGTGQSGNGGAGGYYQVFTVPAGTNSLVCGAGGSAGAGINWDGGTGGTSTFAGYSLNGGAGGRGSGYGGSNAAGGAGAYGGSGGAGGTPTGFPSWRTPGAGGAGGSGSGGGGGGIGAGGAGAVSSNNTGSPGTAGGGGGSGASYSSSNYSGAAGGAGALAALVWS